MALISIDVPGFTTTRDDRRVTLVSDEQVIIWKVTEAGLAQLAAQLKPATRQAFGRGSGEQLLTELVTEAILTFEGSRGELVADRGNLRVVPQD